MSVLSARWTDKNVCPTDRQECLSYSDDSAEQIERVVVRGVNWVGDAVMTIPALRELRRVLPHAHITLATRPWAEGLFADADFLDDLLIYDRRPRDLRAVARQTREWQRRRFDLALLFQNAFEAALIAATARVPVRLGYATDGRRMLLTHSLPLPDWREQRHEVFYYLNLVAELERTLYGVSSVEEREPQFALNISEARKEQARAFLLSEGVRKDPLDCARSRPPTAARRLASRVMRCSQTSSQPRRARTFS